MQIIATWSQMWTDGLRRLSDCPTAYVLYSADRVSQRGTNTSSYIYLCLHRWQDQLLTGHNRSSQHKQQQGLWAACAHSVQLTWINQWHMSDSTDVVMLHATLQLTRRWWLQPEITDIYFTVRNHWHILQLSHILYKTCLFVSAQNKTEAFFYL